jgi:long-subunit fatty acid transport protein
MARRSERQWPDRRARRAHRRAALRRHAPLVAAAIVLAALAAPPARAQFLPRIDFNYSNPGARSLGFGGAFAGLGDDATAAFANPAGLVQLVRPEVSLEGRSWNSSRTNLVGGRVAGEPTGRGLDVHDGLVTAENERRINSPSFAAAVWPRGRWTLAVYGHRLADLELDDESQGAFDDDPDSPRIDAFRERVTLRLDGIGVAAGWRAHERLSVGIAAVRMDLALATRRDQFSPDPERPDTFYDPIPFDDAHRSVTEGLRIDDAATTLTAGLLWNATDQLSGGLFYRRGARLDGTYELVFLPIFDDPGSVDVLRAEFRVPNVWGAGVAFRSASGRVTVAGEVDHVGYSELLKVHSSGTLFVGDLPYLDSWEYRLGGEYALLGRQPIVAFRAGAWVDSHAADFDHDRVTHWAAGVGVAGERVQVDLAADLSSVVDTISLSLIYSF